MGARVAFHEADGFEAGDVELDATYETWGSAQATGPQIHIDHLGPASPAFDNIDIVVAHHYSDTFSLRGGGAYNTRLPFGVFTVRAGAYYDRSATADNPGYTRLDMDTLDKIAGTIGVGLRWNGFVFNLSYADVFEPGRAVAPGTGQIRPIDGAQHGAAVDSQGNRLPAVNEGQYTGHTDIFSFSVMAVFDEILGTRRSKTWGPRPAPAEPHDRAREPKKDEDDEPPPPPEKHAGASRPRAAASPSVPQSPQAPAKKSDWND